MRRIVVAAHLVSATKLHTPEPARQPGVGWELKLYPDAGEAGGSFHGVERVRDRTGLWVPPGEAADPERSTQEADRRARAQVRRYCATHGLNRLGTLTYAGSTRLSVVGLEVVRWVDHAM